MIIHGTMTKKLSHYLNSIITVQWLKNYHIKVLYLNIKYLHSFEKLILEVGHGADLGQGISIQMESKNFCSCSFVWNYKFPHD